MLQIKRLLIILLVLFCCCSKSSSDEKRYRTAILELSIYANTKETYASQKIGIVPFKGRVEIIDNNEVKISEYRSFIKIKYKDTVGYVISSFLSERNDVPFVDKVKYNYSLNEFAYNRKRVIDFVKENMIKYGKVKEPLADEYYIDDPQIYSFLGKDCDRENANYILVIIISKIHKNFNYYNVFTIISKNEYYLEASGINSFTNEDGTEKVKDYIDVFKNGGLCDD